MPSCMTGNLCLVCESSDLWTLPLLNCDWQAESREIDISAPDGPARSGISGNVIKLSEHSLMMSFVRSYTCAFVIS